MNVIAGRCQAGAANSQITVIVTFMARPRLRRGASCQLAADCQSALGRDFSGTSTAEFLVRGHYTSAVTSQVESASGKPRVREGSGTPERIRTSDLLLRRQTVPSLFSNICVRFVDATWTETRPIHFPLAVLKGINFAVPGLSLAAAAIFSAMPSSTSDAARSARGYTATSSPPGCVPSLPSVRRSRVSPDPPRRRMCAGDHARLAMACPTSGLRA